MCVALGVYTSGLTAEGLRVAVSEFEITGAANAPFCSAVPKTCYCRRCFDWPGSDSWRWQTLHRIASLS